MHGGHSNACLQRIVATWGACGSAQRYPGGDQIGIAKTQ